MSRTINVIITDDHELVRTGIRRMIEGAPGIKIVGEADSGEQAIKMVREDRPDVVLMDIKMPGIGGLEATRKLQRIAPDVKVLIITMCDDDLFPSRLLQAGAAGYLTKGSSMDEMLRAIRAVYNGQRYITPNIAKKLALRHLSGAADSSFESLSERELQVALMITRGERVQTISDQLCLSTKTVNSYRYRIFEKLEVQNDVELTLLAIRHGLLDPDATEHQPDTV